MLVGCPVGFLFSWVGWPENNLGVVVKLAVIARRSGLVLGLLILIGFGLMKIPGTIQSGQNERTTLTSVNTLPADSSSGAEAISVPFSGSATITSILRGGGYAFIEVQLSPSSSATLAAAALPSETTVGDTVQWHGARLARDYYSHALERDFPQLYMVSLQAPQAPQAQPKLTSGRVSSVRSEGDLAFVDVDAAGERIRLVVEARKMVGDVAPGARVEWVSEIDKNPDAAARPTDRAGRARLIEVERLSVINPQ